MSQRGGNFRRQNARILHNSTYKGYPAYLKSRRNNFLDQKIIRNRDEDTYLYVKGDFEPIISEEQWDRFRQIREQRVRRNKILTENGEKSHLTGVHTSDDVWTKKLRCRYGNVLQLVYEFRPCRQIRRYEKACVGVYDRL